MVSFLHCHCHKFINQNSYQVNTFYQNQVNTTKITMNLTNLPPEIWMIVINYLDTKSKVNLYNTSMEVRRFFVPNNLKKVTLSRSTLASIHSLKQDLFLDFAKYILELNLSGLHDLTAETLQPYVKGFENLISLDVTYTNIYLSDLDRICSRTLRNININFFKCATGCFKLHQKWDCAKRVFIQQHFKNVHFVVFDFLDSRFPLLFLNELPCIEYFQVDVIDKEKYYERRYSFDCTEELKNINFSRLRYLFRDCDAGNLRDLLKMDFEEVEYIFMMYSKKIVIYVSPIFNHLFSSNSVVTVKVEKVLPNNVVVRDNAILYAWNKNTTIFDEKLFKSIQEEYKDYFPTYICMHNILRTNILNGPTNWYCLDKCEGFDKLLEDEPDKVTFTSYCRIHNITKSVSLSKFNEWDRIRNITFLRISNLYLDDDFISHLFTNCKKIVTLDIYNNNPRNTFLEYMTPLSNAMDQACCLKNLKLTIECTDYNVLFDALGKCQSLENIYICDFVRAFDYISFNPAKVYTLLENCKNLYSLFIEADTTPQVSTILYSSIYEVVQRLERLHLFVDVNCLFYAINPFDDVFSPSPLRIND